MTQEGWIYIFLFITGIFMLFCYYKTGKMLKCMAFSAFTGLPALGLVWVLTKLTPLTLTFTPLTILSSTLMGVPGVVFLLILNLI